MKLTARYSHRTLRAGLAVAVAAGCCSAALAQEQGLPARAESAASATGTISEVTTRSAEQAQQDWRDAVIEQPKPVYTLLAKRFGIEGKVEAAVLIDGNGRALRTQILRRDPVHVDFFDADVRKTLMATRFKTGLPPPGSRAIWLRAPFNFVLEGESSEPPKMTTPVAPELPKEAVEQGVEGWVALWVPVDESGRPDAGRISVRSRVPANFSFFDEKAKEAVMKSGFRPARHGDASKADTALVRIDFRLKND